MNLYQIVAIVSAVICLLGILIGFVGFPLLLVKMIKGSINLKPGSDIRGMWEQVPFPVNFSVYVFNLTNPAETQNGGKPMVSEVGPFVFEEWKDKFNVQDIEEEDAVTFNMRNTFIFRADLGLSGEEVITMPHPLIQVMAISIKSGNPEMIPVVAAAFEGIFKPTSPFITAPFMDIFYRGIDVDCSADNEAVQGICQSFHGGGVKGAVKITETLFKFSLMGAGNHSDAGHFKVSRGIKVSRDLGRVLQYNGADALTVWKGEQCNRFQGTDSTIFPPLMKPAEGLWSFSADLCRSLGARFQKPSNYLGVPVLRYIMDFGDPKNEPENQCFCKDYPNDCPAKGTMDLSLCNQSPMVVSLPHFLDADTKLLEAIDGLSPDVDKHGIFIDFEIISATPLSVAKRMQFSLAVEPINEIEVMKSLRPLVMPLFWIEEAANLDKSVADMLKKKIFGMFKMNNAFKWSATVLGAVGLLFSLYLMWSSKKDKKVNAFEVQPK